MRQNLKGMERAANHRQTDRDAAESGDRMKRPKRRKYHWQNQKKQQQTMKETLLYIYKQGTLVERVVGEWCEHGIHWKCPAVIAEDNGTEPSCCLPTDFSSVWVREMERKRLRQAMGEAQLYSQQSTTHCLILHSFDTLLSILPVLYAYKSKVLGFLCRQEMALCSLWHRVLF